MRPLFAFLTCLIGVSLVGQDCEYNSINIEVVGSDAAIGWNITQDNGTHDSSFYVGILPS